MIIEKADYNYSAYLPDLLGCVTTSDTKEETVQRMHEPIQMHIESLREHGEPVPPPSSLAEFVPV